MDKKVCLDPGHGVETAGKCSPDKSYYEHEFALDMAWRIKAILERHGVEVTMTRTDEHEVTLANRVKIANAIKGLNLFVSLHSNAGGSGGAWTKARGYTVYTSGEDDTAARNKAAKAILKRAGEAGVTLRNNGKPNYNGSLYVLHRTTAPACLIEHLFHDNQEDVALLKTDSYRKLLAEVDAKGILDYLGIAWVDEPQEPEEPTDVKPWYAGPQEWAVSMGIADGTRPEATCTRAEVWTMLQRLYDAMKAGK